MANKSAASGGNTRVGSGLDRHWHLATTDHEVAVTEMEFSLMRVSAAFDRWQADCLACCVPENLGASDNEVLHVIRMHDKPKSISDIARLTNRDDISNLQYNVRKLNKAGLIQKSDSSMRKSADSKKGVTYEVTERGLEVTDQFARFRQELLLSLTESISNWGEDMETVAKVLNLMSGMYDQAGCVAATHRVFS